MNMLNNKIKHNYVGNLGQLRNNVYLGGPRKKKSRPYANDKQFKELVDRATKCYIETGVGISVDQLIVDYNISQRKAEYLYSELRSKGCKRKDNIEISVVSYNQVDKSVIDAYTKLLDIRKMYANEIKIHGEQTSILEGFIYLITNDAFLGWVKVGMSIDYEKRLAVYNQYDPGNGFKIETVKWVPNRRTAELNLIEKLEKLAYSAKGEWFKIDKEKALEYFNI
jgi:hypothetical protein